MTDSFSQTAKGKAEIAAKPGKLTPGLKTLLGMVGDKATIADLKVKLPQVPEDKLTAALDRLVADGYLQRVAPPPGPMHSDASLDFTRFISRPVKEPTLHQKQQAEATIASIRTSRKAGYQVNILNRPAKRIEPRAGGDKYTVLIIDADEANALLMARALLLAKFDTRAASKREEIVGQLNRQPPPDAVAMDIDLPDVGGLELLGRLREHPIYKTIPVVIMTAKVEHDDVVAALAFGANGFLTKPIRPEALLESVRAVLGL
ncbi:MAG: response regulator [Betaproteobacteria bacterium]|nr:response regulator [Betaproteobacteria bacterium]